MIRNPRRRSDRRVPIAGHSDQRPPRAAPGSFDRHRNRMRPVASDGAAFGRALCDRHRGLCCDVVGRLRSVQGAQVRYGRLAMGAGAGCLGAAALVILSFILRTAQ